MTKEESKAWSELLTPSEDSSTFFAVKGEAPKVTIKDKK